MNSNELNIYKSTMDLINLILPIITKFERTYRFTLGEQIIEKLVKTTSYITKANMEKDPELRKNILTDYIGIFEEIKSLIYICDNLKLLGLNGAASIAIHLESIGRQLSAWRKSCDK